MIKLGDRVKEKISGYRGTVISKTEWIYGCVRFGVQADGLHEGKPIPSQGFDEGELTPDGEEAPGPVASKGGPSQNGVETEGQWRNPN